MNPKPYGVNELREMFLSFFESKGHLRLPSFSLIPQNDASLLLINSGMAPMKPYFKGEVEPPRHRVCTCQKCIRTGDIENIGKTARHGTYFEMLGNFSFGDYFKHEAIAWSWEFLTKVVGLDENRLYPSIYENDDEAFEIWNKEVGVPAERIFRFGKEDNFWSMAPAPAAPARKFTTTVARSTAAANPAAPSAATATATWRSGTTSSPSSTTTATATTPSWPRRTSTPAWVWSVWRWSVRTWTPCSMWIPS